jgi:D-beta-D-heptose 7-phosphate kinase/D-beta-D-heptose 1-phosphate adenosyltransferase
MLACVDFVTLFDEETPQRLIAELLPDVLVKGSDYALDEIVGREEVEQAGGRVRTVPLTPNKSSTNIIQTILDRFCP